ncbi:MAG: hypothetical protein ACR2QW_13875 [bacterium]
MRNLLNLSGNLAATVILIGCGFFNAFAQTTETEEDQAPVSEECLAFAADPNADVGDVMRAGCEPTLAQMAALMDNPLGNVAMLFTQFDGYNLENPTNGQDAEQYVYTGIAQFPKRLSKDWNLINRVVWTAPSIPLDQDRIDNFDDGISNLQGNFIPPGSPAPIDLFDGRTTGFGDLYYVGLFAPTVPEDVLNGKLVWGLGFDLSFPTASEDILGSDQYSAGPSALAAYLGPKWKFGALVQHYWDYTGDDDAADVNFTNLQYLYYYSLNSTTSIGAAPNILIDWEQDSDNDVTLPIGIGINKTINIGKVPVRFGVELFYSAIQPDDNVGSETSWRFYMIPAAPSALFKWMQ